MKSHTWTGRSKKPLSKKLNPWWWLWNDDDLPPPGHTVLSWWIRNPFHNLTFYVIGFQDRNFTVYGRDPMAQIAVRKDIGLHGWHWAVLLIGGFFPFPWISYTGDRFVLYAGWQPGGKLGFKFNYTRAT